MSALFSTFGLQQVTVVETYTQDNVPNSELRLFINNPVRDPSTVLSDLTELDTTLCPNYVPYVLFDNPNWVQTAQDVNGFVGFGFPSVVWDLTYGSGSDTIYGWMLVDTNAGALLCSDTFATPIDPAAFNNTLGFSFTYRCRQYPGP